MDKMNSDFLKKVHYKTLPLRGNTGLGHWECFLMQVGTAHSFGFQGPGSPAADAALPLMITHHSTLAGTSHLLCCRHLAPHHRPMVLILIFVVLHSPFISPLILHV